MTKQTKNDTVRERTSSFDITMICYMLENVAMSSARKTFWKETYFHSSRGREMTLVDAEGTL